MEDFMKALSIRYSLFLAAFLVLTSLCVRSIHAQSACDPAPCPTPGSSAPNVWTPNGKGQPTHAPKTPEELAEQNREMRYGMLFSRLEADEKSAQRYDSAGDAATAAAWRGHFAKQSGLRPEEADAIKKIAQDYLRERDVRTKRYMDARSAALASHEQKHPSRINTPEIADAEDSLKALFPTVIANLLSALGSRSFSRLDSYTIHMHENARVSSSQGGDGPSNTSPSGQPLDNRLGGK